MPASRILYKKLYKRLVEMQFERNDFDFKRGTFRIRGDVLDIIPISEHSKGIRIEFFEDEVDIYKYAGSGDAAVGRKYLMHETALREFIKNLNQQ